MDSDVPTPKQAINAGYHKGIVTIAKKLTKNSGGATNE